MKILRKLFILTLIVATVLSLLPIQVFADGESWLTDYSYRKQFTITGSADGILSNYQLKLTINRSSGSDSGLTVYVGTNCEADYDDIRFTKADDATLEPSDSFSLEIGLYLSESGSYVIKEDALELYYNASTEVLYAIMGDSETPDLVLEAADVEAGLHVIKLVDGESDVTEYESASAGGMLEGDSIYGSTFRGQSWTAADSYVLTQIKLKVYTINDVSREGTVYLYEASGEYPTGGYLTYGTYDPSNFTTDGDGDWYTITLDSPVWVTSGTKYVWVNTCSLGIAGDSVWTSVANTVYTGGTGIYSTNGGSSWSTVAKDYQFINVGGSLISLYVDDMETSVDYSDAVLVPDNANDWKFYPNPYFDYIKLETSN